MNDLLDPTLVDMYMTEVLDFPQESIDALIKDCRAGTIAKLMARQQESEGVVVRAIELPDCRPILFIPDKLLGDDHYLVTRIEANDSSL